MSPPLTCPYCYARLPTVEDLQDHLENDCEEYEETELEEEDGEL